MSTYGRTHHQSVHGTPPLWTVTVHDGVAVVRFNLEALAGRPSEIHLIGSVLQMDLHQRARHLRAGE